MPRQRWDPDRCWFLEVAVALLLMAVLVLALAACTGAPPSQEAEWDSYVPIEVKLSGVYTQALGITIECLSGDRQIVRARQVSPGEVVWAPVCTPAIVRVSDSGGVVWADRVPLDRGRSYLLDITRPPLYTSITHRFRR